MSEVVAIHFADSARYRVHRLRGIVFDEEIIDIMVLCQQKLDNDTRELLRTALREKTQGNIAECLK